MAVEQVVNSGLKLKTVESIPAKWRIHQVDELFSFLKTNSLSRNDLSYDYHEFPIYNIHYGDIHATFDSSVLDFEKESRVPVIKSMNQLPKEVDYLSEGDLIMADASEDYDGVGEAIEILNLKGRQVLAGLHTIALRGDHRTALGFRSYIFKHPGVVKSLRVIATGTKVYGISKSNVSKLRVILPSLTEQRKIAEILSTWDEAIAQTKALIEQLKLRNKGLAQQLLTGKKRLKGFSGEWKEVKLEKYFSERNERGFDDLNLLSVGELGVYPQSESNKKDTSNADKAKYKRICPGDIGYNTMRMWQGRSALSSLEGIVSPAYTIVTPKENADPRFFALLFKQEPVIHKFFRNSQGLVSDTLNCKFKDLKNVKVFVPMDKSEQSQIAKIITKGSEEIKGLEQKMLLFKEQKKGLMQKLLTGEVRTI